jgi:hypothetical protein
MTQIKLYDRLGRLAMAAALHNQALYPTGERDA